MQNPIPTDAPNSPYEDTCDYGALLVDIFVGTGAELYLDLYVDP